MVWSLVVPEQYLNLMHIFAKNENDKGLQWKKKNEPSVDTALDEGALFSLEVLAFSSTLL